MSEKLNATTRRDFLKSSSVAVAGGALASSLSVTQAVYAAGDDTVKFGLVGCGGRGTGAAGQAMNTSGPTKLVAMADAFDSQLQRSLKILSKQHREKVDVPQERQFVGFDAYNKVLNSDIDLVIFATPPGFRPLHVEAAVNAGKHVFMEKPVAVDAAGVRRVLAATKMAKEKNLALAVGLQRRHERRYRETIERLQDGAIGDIVLARAYWNGGGMWVRDRMKIAIELDHVPTEMEYQMRNWYYFNWLCGDHIVEQHIHNLDVINWLKQGYAVTAQGQGGRQVRTGKEHGEIFDHHVVEFTYGDGTKLFSQCRHIRNCFNSVSEHAHGTKGNCNIGGAVIRDLQGQELWKFGRGGAGGHQQEHHDLFADLRAGVLPNEGEYGAMSTMTSILGRMATYSGKEISMDDALNSKLVISPVDKFANFDGTPPTVPDGDGNYPVPVPGVTRTV